MKGSGGREDRCSGVDLLRANGFEVDRAREHLEHIGDYDGLLIRSATQVADALLGQATNLKAIGRAGVGIDNVDVTAATKRGIIVANAPESNVVTAAEHTMALLLAMARNVPQAQASLKDGRWDRSKYSGVELMDKALGILGFGRIGQLVAERAKGFGMRVVAYDPFVGAERYRQLGVEKAESPDDVYAMADFLTLHLPKTPETEGSLNAEAFAKCKDGVRILNVARGPLVVDEDLQAALEAARSAAPRSTSSAREPVTEHPLFGYDKVIVTPHLGASTAEATDRAGYQAAEQIVAALTGGAVTTAVNVPASPPRTRCGSGRTCHSARARPHRRRPRRGGSVDRVEVELPRRPRRVRHPPARHRGPARRAQRAHRRGRERGQRSRDRARARD